MKSLHFAQFFFEDFAHQRFGHRLENDHFLRNKEFLQFAFAVFQNVVGCHRLPGLQRDKGPDVLAVNLVPDADDGGFGYGRMGIKHFFDDPWLPAYSSNPS